MIIESLRSFRLSIDKASFTCTEINPTRVKEAANRLIRTANDGLSGLQIRPGTRYQIQGTLPIMGPENPLFFQVGPRHSKLSHYRFEFNPSKVGRDGLNKICSFLDSHFETGTRSLFANGKFTRIDIALDLDGLTLDEVVVRSLGQRKHSVHTGQYGQIETVYAGSGAKSRTVVYAKKSEDGTNFLRLERRLKPYIRGHDLFEMPNPFTKVQMVATSALEPHLHGMKSSHFFDVLRMRGVNHAIVDLPLKQRKAIKAAFADPANSVLPPKEQVWAEWPTLLNRTGIGPLCIATENLEAAE